MAGVSRDSGILLVGILVGFTLVVETDFWLRTYSLAVSFARFLDGGMVEDPNSTLTTWIE